MADLASQLAAALRELESKIVRKEVLRDAVVRSVQPLLQKGAELAPRGKGGLSGSMTTQSFINATDVVVRAGPGRPKGSHGILLEYGTIHMTARPFLASAYAATQQEISDAMEIEIADLIL